MDKYFKLSEDHNFPNKLALTISTGPSEMPRLKSVKNLEAKTPKPANDRKFFPQSKSTKFFSTINMESSVTIGCNKTQNFLLKKSEKLLPIKMNDIIKNKKPIQLRTNPKLLENNVFDKGSLGVTKKLNDQFQRDQMLCDSPKKLNGRKSPRLSVQLKRDEPYDVDKNLRTHKSTEFSNPLAFSDFMSVDGEYHNQSQSVFRPMAHETISEVKLDTNTNIFREELSHNYKTMLDSGNKLEFLEHMKQPVIGKMNDKFCQNRMSLILKQRHGIPEAPNTDQSQKAPLFSTTAVYLLNSPAGGPKKPSARMRKKNYSEIPALVSSIKKNKHVRKTDENSETQVKTTPVAKIYNHNTGRLCNKLVTRRSMVEQNLEKSVSVSRSQTISDEDASYESSKNSSKCSQNKQKEDQPTCINYLENTKPQQSYYSNAVYESNIEEIFRSKNVKYRKENDFMKKFTRQNAIVIEKDVIDKLTDIKNMPMEMRRSKRISNLYLHEDENSVDKAPIFMRKESQSRISRCVQLSNRGSVVYREGMTPSDKNIPAVDFTSMIGNRKASSQIPLDMNSIESEDEDDYKINNLKRKPKFKLKRIGEIFNPDLLKDMTKVNYMENYENWSSKVKENLLNRQKSVEKVFANVSARINIRVEKTSEHPDIRQMNQAKNTLEEEEYESLKIDNPTLNRREIVQDKKTVNKRNTQRGALYHFDSKKVTAEFEKDSKQDKDSAQSSKNDIESPQLSPIDYRFPLVPDTRDIAKEKLGLIDYKRILLKLQKKGISIMEGNKKLAKELSELKESKNMNKIGNELFGFVTSGKVYKISRFVKIYPNIITHRNAMGNNIIHYIIQKGDKDDLRNILSDPIFEFLLQKQNIFGETPLEYAKKQNMNDKCDIIVKYISQRELLEVESFWAKKPVAKILDYLDKKIKDEDIQRKRSESYKKIVKNSVQRASMKRKFVEGALDYLRKNTEASVGSTGKQLQKRNSIVKGKSNSKKKN